MCEYVLENMCLGCGEHGDKCLLSAPFYTGAARVSPDYSMCMQLSFLWGG